MRRDHCGGCHADTLEVFLDLGKTPLADRFPASADEPEPTFPLEVAVCTSCWLVQLLEVVPDAILWADYGFYSGASPSKVAYHERYAAWALKEFGEQAKRLTVEIGCNDGDLLRHFQDAGCRAVGIDPARGPAATAFARIYEVWNEPFGRDSAAALRDKYGPAGLVIANHVAAHVADPHDFFGGIADLLASDGVAVVEVQYLGDLLTGNQFDHVYHEHRFFYSVGSLASVAAKHGLSVAEVIQTEQQGGSIRVVLYRDQDNRPLEYVAGLKAMHTYWSFQHRVDYIRARLLEALDGEREAGRRLAGYGATAKSTTLLNYLGLGPDLLEYVEDTTPAKIGRVTPGTHIPIVGPAWERGNKKTLWRMAPVWDRDTKKIVMTRDQRSEIITHGQRPDTYLLLAWNYLPGVLRRERDFLDGGGRFLVPIPVPVLL